MKNDYILTILTSLLITSVGCLDYNPNPSDWTYSISWVVSPQNTNVTYNITLPFTSDELENITLNGYGPKPYQYVETPYGNGLNITATGTFSMVLTSSNDNFSSFHFSMKAENNTSYHYVFLSSTDENLTVRIRGESISESEYACHTYTIEGWVYPGWQIIRGRGGGWSV